MKILIFPPLLIVFSRIADPTTGCYAHCNIVYIPHTLRFGLVDYLTALSMCSLPSLCQFFFLLMPFSSVDMPELPRQKPKVGEPKVGELSEKSNPHLIFFMFSAY